MKTHYTEQGRGQPVCMKGLPAGHWDVTRLISDVTCRKCQTKVIELIEARS